MTAVPVPPPLIPPPPPPPAPASGLTSVESGRKNRLRKLNWEQIPRERVEGRRSVWSGSLDEDKEVPIDLNSLDELFGQKEGAKLDRANSFRQSLLRCGSPQETTVDKVSLLDSKRSMNVGIFLRQLKIAACDIVEDVRRGSGERYGAEKLSELCKLLPDKDEEARLKKFNGDRSFLPEADLFVLLLVELPSFRMRLDVMMLQQEFDLAVTSLCAAARCLGEAAGELLSCTELHYILRLVLKAGNYMNAGGYAGNAAGFRISSLLKLADTKANKPGMNLLHFVAMEVVKKNKDLLMFHSHLTHVTPASRLSEASVEEDLSRLQSRVADLRLKAQSDAEIEQQTRSFLEDVDVRLQEAQDEVESLQKTSKALMEFLCDDEKSFKLEEACFTFHCFCQRFQKAVRENTERELQEQRRAARERDNVDKRRSLALCTGLEVERESDDLEHALQKSLRYTGCRRSLHRNMKSDNQPRDSMLKTESLQNDTNTAETGQSRSEKEGQCLSTDSACGLQRVPAVTPDTMKSLSRLNTRRVPSDGALVVHAESGITSQQQEAVNVLPLTGLSPNRALKVEKGVQDASERLAQILTDAPEDTEKKDNELSERSGNDTLAQSEIMPQTKAKTDSGLVGETWLSSSPAETTPSLIENLEPCSPERVHVYPRVGEVLECHTLVRGLRSYESLSPPVVRPATNHCTKWKKEREAEKRDGASSLHAKEESRLLKTATRGSSKRSLAPRGGPSNSSGIPRVRTKAEPIPSNGLSGSHGSRPFPLRSTSVRSTQVTSNQNELKHNAGAPLKTNVQSDTKQKRNATEAVKSKSLEQFVRGSPLRVSKRYAPISDPKTLDTSHSPTAATTAKTIRTAVINLAKAKTTKRPGPKTPRPAPQPTWR
ncbi:FH2 domain-containing protein 1 [Triplophysa tibetana]|uniref:FH2 domain-containing protein 1 n=1 Tax=Triplophysa tibetana TaxID=1572043 RepID=A0A5A9NGK1_9TELE|nr:FH2 domain-containing protein 1 [Triplophysa tibetana]